MKPPKPLNKLGDEILADLYRKQMRDGEVKDSTSSSAAAPDGSIAPQGDRFLTYLRSLERTTFSPQQIAEMLELSESSIYRDLKAKKMVGHKIKGQWRVYGPALADYIERQ